jgi:hypothetical protein
MHFDITYTQEQGPPRIDWDSYEAKTMDAFRKLLDNARDEREVQAFLERNPSMVPGAWTPGPPSGHYPLFHALISQPKLPGFKSRVPDFSGFPRIAAHGTSQWWKLNTLRSGYSRKTEPQPRNSHKPKRN